MDMRFYTGLTLQQPQPGVSDFYEYVLPVGKETVDGKKNVPTHVAHSVDIAFAVTFHKVQGCTVKRALVDLCFETAKEATMQMIYVALSRFESLDSFRLLPYDSVMPRLSQLSWPDKLVKFFARELPPSQVLRI